VNRALAQMALVPQPGPTLAEFESLNFEAEKFDHEAHVFVAWSYVQEFDLLTAIDRYRSTLRRLTSKLGIPGKYHETITWFYMIAVKERAIGAAAADWNCFREGNPDIFERKPGILEDNYSKARLMSDQARATFLLPDL